MDQNFYTSTEAAKITNCSRRQLQYWREQGVVVPTVNTTGKGKNVYYSQTDLLALILIRYVLSLGLSFEVCQQTLKMLRQQEAWIFEEPPKKEKSFLIILDSTYSENIPRLENFDPQLVWESVNKDTCIATIRSSRIHELLHQNLKRFAE
ncbi:MAG: MerR family transcriptional regulator [Mojavia pulchra JT2-VF2]|jgi:DNA-binding transcriptional MerR regulator|uniref:MerR family transcriptional regulator n=1 Tax=Mojavia pulchra JT2-VF2 TaxID=287848 RepID=A0A951PYI9_9NOST|nr:MerR family transcriptional regulator [Mojavia pulchra JT2-VF2]